MAAKFRTQTPVLAILAGISALFGCAVTSTEPAGATFDDADAAAKATDAGTVDVHAENTKDSSSEDARITADAGPVGDRCETPTIITMTGTTVILENETTAGFSNSYSGSGTCIAGDGRDHVYAVIVPPNKQLSASVKSAAGFDQFVEIVVGDTSKCDAIASVNQPGGSTCAIGSDSAGAGGTDEVSYFNAGNHAQTAFVIVDAAADSEFDSHYSLQLTVDSPPAGDACENATHITPGVLNDQSTVGYGNNYGGDAKNPNTGCRRSPGPERVYAIDIPPHTKLLAAVTPSGEFDSGINIVVGDASRCNIAPRICDGGNDDGTELDRDVAGYVNASNLTVTAFIMVDAYQAGLAGTFSLETSLEAVTVSPTGGETCNAPELLTAPGDESPLSVQGTTVGYENDYSGSNTCLTSPGRDHIYSVSVPAGKQLYASIASDPGFDQLINLVPGNASACGSLPLPRVPLCSVGADRGAGGGTDNAAYFNGTASTQNVFIMADSYIADTGGTYTLSVRVATPPPGEVCEQAEAITAGTVAATLVGYGNNYSNATNPTLPAAGCSASSGADRVFRFDLAAGKTLDVAVAPSPDLDPSLNLVVGTASDCNGVPRVCTTSDDSGGAGEEDSLSYENTSSVTQSVFIIVDTFAPTTTGTFTLTTAVR